VTSDNPLARAVRAFAGGDLSSVARIRAANRTELDGLASESARYRLTRAELSDVLRNLPLDYGSQNVARIWAFFWREGLFPQQVEGESLPLMPSGMTIQASL